MSGIGTKQTLARYSGCPLSGAKRTTSEVAALSASDPILPWPSFAAGAASAEVSKTISAS